MALSELPYMAIHCIQSWSHYTQPTNYNVSYHKPALKTSHTKKWKFPGLPEGQHTVGEHAGKKTEQPENKRIYGRATFFKIQRRVQSEVKRLLESVHKLEGRRWYWREA